MEQDRNRLFFFSLSFSFPFLSLVSQHVAAPDSFHSLFLPHGKNESYTKLRAKTFVVSILIGSMMGFFGRKKLFGILTFLVAFLAGNLSREVQKNVRRKSFRLVIQLSLQRIQKQCKPIIGICSLIDRILIKYQKQLFSSDANKTPERITLERIYIFSNRDVKSAR